MTEKIRILTTDFKLNFVERLRDKEGVNSLRGDICYSHPEIRIDTEQSEQLIYQTIWHEVLHGIADQMDVEMAEGIVIKLTNGLVSVLRDNRALMDKYYPECWL